MRTGPLFNWFVALVVCLPAGNLAAAAPIAPGAVENSPSANEPKEDLPVDHEDMNDLDESSLLPPEQLENEAIETVSSSSRISCFARNSRGRSFRSTGPRRDASWVQSDAVRVCRNNSPSPSSCRGTGCRW